MSLVLWHQVLTRSMVFRIGVVLEPAGGCAGCRPVYEKGYRQDVCSSVRNRSDLGFISCLQSAHCEEGLDLEIYRNRLQCLDMSAIMVQRSEVCLSDYSDRCPGTCPFKAPMVLRAAAMHDGSRTG